jgi:uncharacterized membrane protein YgcG
VRVAGYTAIGDAGRSLVALLRTELEQLVDADEVALAAPASVGREERYRVTLHLYRVDRNAHLWNGGDGGEEAVPPSTLPLDLYYRLTAHPPRGAGDQTHRTAVQHEILGAAMRALHKNAILRGDDLRGEFAADEVLHVTMLSTDGTASADAGDTQLRPSVPYLVTPVVVESEGEQPPEEPDHPPGRGVGDCPDSGGRRGGSGEGRGGSGEGRDKTGEGGGRSEGGREASGKDREESG